MKRKIRSHAAGVTIEISGIDVDTDQLLSAFAECRDGRCSCATDEYSKLASLEAEQSAGTVTVRLNAKAGQTFDQTKIEKCLDHTTARLSSED